MSRQISKNSPKLSYFYYSIELCRGRARSELHPCTEMTEVRGLPDGIHEQRGMPERLVGQVGIQNERHGAASPTRLVVLAGLHEELSGSGREGNPRLPEDV
ncbi:MAG: hypothetical protein ABII02_03170 [Candidatus Magasanikbacteria bacterium]